jgi:acyl-CoA thioesterase FadM
MDLGRLDMMARSGLLRAAIRHRWTPIASTMKIRYRRELRLLDRVRLETRLLTWDDLSVVMEQVFVLETGRYAEQVAAQALFKGGLYDRNERRFLPISRLMQEIGVSAASPPPSPDVEAFLKADEELKRKGAERG